MTKLTKAQSELLDMLGRRPRVTSKVYRPSQALVRLGLADWEDGFSHVSHTRTICITPAGRAQLSEHSHG